MGLCNNCLYYTKSGTSLLDGIKNTFTGYNGCNDIGFCRLFTDSYGNYKKVKGLDTCNYFAQKPTGSSGYSSGSSGCFLTSACVDYLNKSDDCEELTILRNFRDNYMKTDKKLATLVDEYYEVAPAIVEYINSSPYKDGHYQFIYETVKTCIQHINAGENEDALTIYKNMVLRFRELINI